MQYINVSQFYQSILCFSIPLLLIQRIILYCFDLAAPYQDYRRLFYDDQFKFTKQYDFAVQQSQNTATAGPPQQITHKDHMLEKHYRADTAQINQHDQKSIQINQLEYNSKEIRDRLQSFGHNDHNINNTTTVKRESFSHGSQELKKKNKIDIDLETDRQLKNKDSHSAMNKQQKEEQQPKIKAKQSEGKYQIQQSEVQSGTKSPTRVNTRKSKQIEGRKSKEQQKQQKKDKVEQIEQSRVSRVTQSDIEVRRETQLSQQLGPGDKNDPNQMRTESKEKELIELGRGRLQEQGELDKTRMRYCRRVEDAFNDYIPIIMSVVVLGILTKSVYIYSMCCFFGYAFSSLLFNYGHLLERLEGPRNKTLFGRVNHLISSLFIIGLFISYWASGEFY